MDLAYNCSCRTYKSYEYYKEIATKARLYFLLAPIVPGPAAYLYLPPTHPIAAYPLPFTHCRLPSARSSSLLPVAIPTTTPTPTPVGPIFHPAPVSPVPASPVYSSGTQFRHTVPAHGARRYAPVVRYLDTRQQLSTI